MKDHSKLGSLGPTRRVTPPPWPVSDSADWAPPTVPKHSSFSPRGAGPRHPEGFGDGGREAQWVQEASSIFVLEAGSLHTSTQP